MMRSFSPTDEPPEKTTRSSRAERRSACRSAGIVSATRGRRTGRRLVEQVIAAAREIGYRRLVLDTLPQMTQALALYRWFGFREIPRYDANPLPGVVYLALDL